MGLMSHEHYAADLQGRGEPSRELSFRRLYSREDVSMTEPVHLIVRRFEFLIQFPEPGFPCDTKDEL